MNNSDDTQLLTEIRDLLRAQAESTREWREANRGYEARYQEWKQLQKRHIRVWTGAMFALMALMLLQLFIRFSPV